ncbi:Ser/Thr protein kinase RdoA (MazF antagonist) [Novosphingobium sp. SG751A]|uniref:phosphotransferase n=1 Tax=Novosphingobium sp. SG751A TaxID=2587000 RepID=UPI0015531BD8|nr:phosphotransferase [Novosphingobium sp. SG751A]NOW48536.1 Ser/Thr protein kinase RdoA (MazF antagonist) [Novosphingobium sp. SG751A]
MLLDPTLTTQPPQLTTQDAQVLARRFYGRDLKASELSGERDRNFKMVGQEGSQYLLKVSNPAEARDIVNLQTCVLNHLAGNATGLSVPRPVAALDGSYEMPITLDDGRVSILRMLTFLPGLQLGQSRRTTAQRRALGQTLARLDQALEGFVHPAAQHDILWNVAAAHRLTGMIDSVADPSGRKLMQRFMAQYQTETLPQLHSLRAQVIHNDYNLGNVLVNPAQTDQIAAIIDFGDVVHAPLVGEIATAAAYQMADGADPLLSAAEIIGGFHEVLALRKAEQAVLLDLITARFMITVLITEWRAARYPENREYIMRNNGLAWAGLNHLAGFSRDEASRQLLQFCLSGDE